MMEDPYKILGVSPDASDDEIKRAYRKLAKQYHPDLHPGDAEAARKMQQVNDAYERIKNPEKFRGSASGNNYTGYGPFGSEAYAGSTGDSYQQAAAQYIRFRRFREALNALSNASNRNARWYYLSALANDGLGNQVTALEHMKRAVSMEPDNYEYIQALEILENGGTTYRRQAQGFYTFGGGRSSIASICICYVLQLICCRGRCCYC